MWCRQFVATVTAYDLASGLFCGVGHKAGNESVIGLPVYAASAVRAGNDQGPLVARVQREQIGIITRQSSFGISGHFYPAKTGEVLTGLPVAGFAEVISCAVPQGRLATEIVAVSGGYIRMRMQKGTVVKGMSGSPILQGGRLVGALYGEDCNNVLGIPIDSMTNSLF